jgi:hypothetical protein
MQLGMLHILTYTLKLTVITGLDQNYDKRDDFNFPIVNFPFICSNIPEAPAYGAYISLMIRYSIPELVVPIRISLQPKRKLLNQEFLLVKLKSSHRKFTVTISAG